MAYSVHMDAEEARRMVAEGGTLLLLDAPEQLVFGIDQTVRSRLEARLQQLHHAAMRS